MAVAGTGTFQRLDAHEVDATLSQLITRIEARFPERNLVNVADELHEAIARVTEESSSRRRQLLLVRWAIGVFAGAIGAAAILAIVLALRDAINAASGTLAFEWLPVVESAINDIAFAGIAIFFLLSLPGRQRRRSGLAVLDRLRSLAHVIDMHQLSKDPDRLLSLPAPTGASLPNDLAAPQLGRYLVYCSELLALVAKTAALCAQEVTDDVVLDRVSEIEILTSEMSRKIWLKVSVLHGAHN
jgi:hypothetical protein